MRVVRATATYAQYKKQGQHSSANKIRAEAQLTRPAKMASGIYLVHRNKPVRTSTMPAKAQLTIPVCHPPASCVPNDTVSVTIDVKLFAFSGATRSI